MNSKLGDVALRFMEVLKTLNHSFTKKNIPKNGWLRWEISELKNQNLLSCADYIIIHVCLCFDISYLRRNPIWKANTDWKKLEPSLVGKKKETRNCWTLVMSHCWVPGELDQQQPRWARSWPQNPTFAFCCNKNHSPVRKKTAILIAPLG